MKGKQRIRFYRATKHPQQSEGPAGESKMKNELQTFLTPPEIAKSLRVSPEKVVAWIRDGRLKAINVSNQTRPRYRVSHKDLNAFLKEIEVPSKRSPKVNQQRKQRPPEGGPIDPALGERLLAKGMAVKHGKTYYRVWNGVTLYF